MELSPLGARVRSVVGLEHLGDLGCSQGADCDTGSDHGHLGGDFSGSGGERLECVKHDSFLGWLMNRKHYCLDSP